MNDDRKRPVTAEQTNKQPAEASRTETGGQSAEPQDLAPALAAVGPMGKGFNYAEEFKSLDLVA